MTTLRTRDAGAYLRPVLVIGDEWPYVMEQLPGAVVWSPDGRTLARRSGARVALYDADTLKNERRLTFADDVHTLAFSPDSQRLAVGSGHDSAEEDQLVWPSRGELSLWRVAAAEQLTVTSMGGAVQKLGFDPSGAWIAVEREGWARTLVGSGPEKPPAASIPVGGADVAADGRYPNPERTRIAVIRDRRLSVEDAGGTIVLVPSLGRVLRIAFSPDHTLLFVEGNERGEIWQLDPNGQAPARLVDRVALGEIRWPAPAPPARVTVAASKEQIEVDRPAAEPRTFELELETVVATALSPDGSHLAVSATNAGVYVVAIEPARVAGVAAVNTWAMAFSADGRRLACGDRKGCVDVYDVPQR